jgi:Fic family protein
MEPFRPKPLPPEGIDWSALVGLIGEARAALGEYEGRLGGIPHPHVLLSPLSAKEAVLSSRIEGTVVTLQEVLQFASEEPALPRQPSPREQDIREVLNYRRALTYAFGELRASKPVGLNFVKRLHWILMDGVRGRDKGRGEFRRVQNHIGAAGSSIEQATYVPPPGDPLMEHLTDWERYYNDEGQKDPVVQASLLHAQFELIHPFVDGNGRVGRMLIPLFLCERGVLPAPTFYISGYFEATRDEYYGRLLALSRDDDWNGWIRYFLGGVIGQARKNAAQAQAIMQLHDEAQQIFQRQVRTVFALQAIEFLFSAVIFRAADFLRQTGIPTRATAGRILARLVDAGLLEVQSPGRGRRSTVYVFPKLYSIVDA